MRLLFYNTYVLPVFDYGCVIWCNGTLTHLNKIINAQKRAARMILDKKYDHHSAHLYKELKWLPFIERCNYYTGILVCKSLNDMRPKYITKVLKLNTTSHDLRSEKCLVHPLLKSRYTKYTLQYSAMNVWNDIPLNIRNSSTLSTFKINYRSYLQNKCNQQ